MSQWTIEELIKCKRTPSEVPLRGCYLLVAVGHENGQEAVELYFGSSDNMANRFEGHASSIKYGKNVQYFHQRCRDLKVERPLFIPVSYEKGGDDLALYFQESGHIAMVGTWRLKNAKATRLATWRAVRRMKLVDEDEKLPPGWDGANCEIPFVKLTPSFEV